jgi:hypothetical protein
MEYLLTYSLHNIKSRWPPAETTSPSKSFTRNHLFFKVFTGLARPVQILGTLKAQAEDHKARESRSSTESGSKDSRTVDKKRRTIRQLGLPHSRNNGKRFLYLMHHEKYPVFLPGVLNIAVSSMVRLS